MKTKHTPGPWTALEGVRDTFNLPQYQRKDRCYVVLDKERMLPVAEMRLGCPSANARLIAAAPELLEALETIAREVTKLDAEFKGGFSWKHVNLVRAAIAKATGGAE